MNNTEIKVINAQNVSKSFIVGKQRVSVLRDITLDIRLYDFLIIYGPSGCGKTTLLHTILGLEQPTSGKILFFGRDLYESMSEDEQSDFRKRHIGMVYQQPNWIKSITVLENVAFPMLLLGRDKKVCLEKAQLALETTAMMGWAHYMPMELSSGQQQMVELARALINEPEVIIADEPTGNLDYETGQKVMQFLIDLNKHKNKTVVMVTHDLEYLKFAKTRVRMLNGEVINISRGKEGVKESYKKDINHTESK